MKTHLTLLLAFVCVAIVAAPAQAQRQDPLGDSMIPPQLILQNADAIGLDANQKEFIESQMRQVQEKFPELQRDLQKEVAALAELMKQEKPDQEKVLDQLDKVLNGERAIKRAQVALALSIRNKLTPQQVSKLREMQQKMMAEARNRGPGNGPPESLRAKAQQVQQIGVKMQQEGKDPTPLREAMAQVQQLMQQGKAKEAEEVLDRVIKQFSGEAKTDSPKPASPKEPPGEKPRSSLYPPGATTPPPAALAPIRPAPAPVATSNGANWSRDDAAHLLRRAGFGGTPAEIDRLHALGKAAAVEYLVSGDLPAGAKPPLTHVEIPPVGYSRDIAWFGGGPMVQFQLEKLKVWALDRMVRSDRPLEEKMTLFWHNIFTSNIRDVADVRMMVAQDSLLRHEALGNYKRLTQAIIHDAAMIRYLNNDLNVAGRSNENLARELMELFTMGEGRGYTEADIPEVARALTGMTANRITGVAEFMEARHDSGEKKIFGKTGKYMPDDVADLIFDRSEPASYLAKRLWIFFGTPEPTEQDIAPVAEALKNGNWELAPALRALFNSAAFYEPRCRFAIVKSPLELHAMTLRLLEQSESGVMWASMRAFRGQGQEMFQPPNVKGWPGGERWITASSMNARYTLAMQSATGRLSAIYSGMLAEARQSPPVPAAKPTDPNLSPAEKRQAQAMMMRLMESQQVKAEIQEMPELPPTEELVSVARLFPKLPKNPTREQVIDAAAERFLQRPIADEKRAALIEALGAEPLTVGESQSDDRIRMAIGLIMSTPEYQVQ